MKQPINYTPEHNGKSAALCCFCGRCSRAVTTCGGEPDLFALPQGWSQAPYPPDFLPRDGSRGSMYNCPARGRLGEKHSKERRMNTVLQKAVRKIRTTTAGRIIKAIDYRRDLAILNRADKSGELHNRILAAREEQMLSTLIRKAN